MKQLHKNNRADYDYPPRKRKSIFVNPCVSCSGSTQHRSICAGEFEGKLIGVSTCKRIRVAYLKELDKLKEKKNVEHA